tara:strand:+ start:16924 stop:17148 length:225 start_codon:yes stop_codon:yes gene_type:complete
MSNKPFWSPDKIRELRHRIFVDSNGEWIAINQTDFGTLVGGYTQPTVSIWETAGCTSKRGCADLERAKQAVEDK